MGEYNPILPSEQLVCEGRSAIKELTGTWLLPQCCRRKKQPAIVLGHIPGFSQQLN